MYNFTLIDHTTSATPKDLQASVAEWKNIFDAIHEQVASVFGAEFGDFVCNFQVPTDPKDPEARPVGSIAINIRDTLPDAPGALAYHAVTNGIPDVEVAASLFQSLALGPESLSGGIDHEILELLGDPGANAYCDRQDGSGEMDSQETCDFVQNTGYHASNGVYLSNFVKRNFFVPGSTGPWDHLGVMKSRYDVSNGYGILMSEGQSDQIGGMRVIGSLSDLQRQRKMKPTSRSLRRVVARFSAQHKAVTHLAARAIF